MLAKYGADSDTRLILGHHQTHKGASEVYARDVQSAPLRVMEAMFKDIRKGHFRPNETRSGMINRQVAPAEPVTNVPLPVGQQPESLVDPESPLATPVQEPFQELEEEHMSFSDMPGMEGRQDTEATETCQDDTSSSSSDSDADSCLDEVVEKNSSGQVGCQTVSFFDKDDGKTEYYQHRSSKVVHVLSVYGTSFLCGRQLTKEYRNCSLLLVVESMKCQQCARRASGRAKEAPSSSLGAAVKRARRE